MASAGRIATGIFSRTVSLIKQRTGRISLLAAGAGAAIGWAQCKDRLLRTAILNGKKMSSKLLVHLGARHTWHGREATERLFAAVRDGSRDVVETLLAHGVRPEGLDELGRTPLVCAFYYEQHAIARLLMRYGARLHDCDAHAVALLMRAVFRGEAASVQGLFQAGLGVNVCDQYGITTALMAAASSADLGIVHLLLRQGANVQLTDGRGRTALDVAIANGCFAVARALVTHGARINEHWGRVEDLYRAFENNDERAFLRLMELDPSSEPPVRLVRALKLRNYGEVATLIDEGVRLEGTHQELRTLFFDSFERNGPGDRERIDWLVKAGLDVNAYAEDGSHVLIMALERYHDNPQKNAIVHALVNDYGVRLDAGDGEGVNALVQAAADGDYAFVEDLLVAGIDANVPDAQGRYALFEAAKREVPGMACPNQPCGKFIVQLLAEHGDLHIDDEAKQQAGAALRLATRHGNNFVINLLLDAGADINETDTETGDCAFLEALASNNQHLVEYLIERGATLDCNDVEHAHAMNVRAIELLDESVLHGVSRSVRALLDAQVNIDLQDENGCSPFIRALQGFVRGEVHKDIIDMFLPRRPFVDPDAPSIHVLLREVLRKNDLESLHILMRVGIDVNMVFGDGEGNVGPLLSHAAALGRVEALETLIRNGAVVDQQPHAGVPGDALVTLNPLASAINADEMKAAFVLARAGARVTPEFIRFARSRGQTFAGNYGYSLLRILTRDSVPDRAMHGVRTACSRRDSSGSDDRAEYSGDDVDGCASTASRSCVIGGAGSASAALPYDDSAPSIGRATQSCRGNNPGACLFKRRGSRCPSAALSHDEIALLRSAGVNPCTGGW